MQNSELENEGNGSADRISRRWDVGEVGSFDSAGRAFCDALLRSGWPANVV